MSAVYTTSHLHLLPSSLHPIFYDAYTHITWYVVIVHPLLTHWLHNYLSFPREPYKGRKRESQWPLSLLHLILVTEYAFRVRQAFLHGALECVLCWCIPSPWIQSKRIWENTPNIPQTNAFQAQGTLTG